MRKALKIIIFDGSFKTTAFVNRLVEGLAKKHSLYVLGFNERLQKKISGVTYVPLGSNQSKVKFIKTTLRLAFQTKSLKLIVSTFAKLIKGKKKALQQQNLKITVQKINPDIIHLQWPSVISWFENILKEEEIPVILSQRGFHNNVRPFVYQSNFHYLSTWYPKIAGFHSVSRAISIKGDLLYKSSSKIDKVVYTGILLKNFPFSKNYQKNDALKIISIGRPHWIKDYRTAIWACKQLKEQNIDFHYTLVGAKDNEELQFLIHELGLQAEISLLNKMPQQEVFKRIKEADVLLLSSIEEGLANVVVEAMALGTPVISTDCGGMSEVILHNQTGWLVPTRNPQKMSEAIAQVAKLSHEEIEQVRKAARKKIEVQHNLANMINGMQLLYHEVLAAHKKTKNPNLKM